MQSPGRGPVHLSGQAWAWKMRIRNFKFLAKLEWWLPASTVPGHKNASRRQSSTELLSSQVLPFPSQPDPGEKGSRGTEIKTETLSKNKSENIISSLTLFCCTTRSCSQAKTSSTRYGDLFVCLKQNTDQPEGKQHLCQHKCCTEVSR